MTNLLRRLLPLAVAMLLSVPPPACVYADARMDAMCPGVFNESRFEERMVPQPNRGRRYSGQHQERTTLVTEGNHRKVRFAQDDVTKQLVVLKETYFHPPHHPPSHGSKLEKQKKQHVSEEQRKWEAEVQGKTAISHHKKELDVAETLAASGALEQPAAKHLCLPSQCFKRPGLNESCSYVMLYAEVLQPFAWLKSRTSHEWWDITRQLTSGLELLADHGVLQVRRLSGKMNV